MGWMRDLYAHLFVQSDAKTDYKYRLPNRSDYLRIKKGI
jgi:hypothetical protein